jgi:hypothetical protein
MSWWLWVIAAEYAGLGLLWLWTVADQARDRAAMRKLAVQVWTRAPMSTTMPTVAALDVGEWVVRAPACSSGDQVQ